MDAFKILVDALAHNTIIQLVVIAVVMDTLFGAGRALKQHKFNSSAYAWQYEEAALTMAEYAEYEDLVAQVETPAIQALQEQNSILQAALADIYESVAEQQASQESTNLAILEGLAALYETQEGTV